MFGLSELAILLIVALVVFGAKKLPELARNAGKAARILKSEAKAMKAEDSGAEQQPAPLIVQPQPGDGPRTRPGDGPGNGSIRTWPAATRRTTSQARASPTTPERRGTTCP